MLNQMLVIPSEVEESRGEACEVVPRAASTSLSMTAARLGFHHFFVIHEACQAVLRWNLPRALANGRGFTC